MNQIKTDCEFNASAENVWRVLADVEKTPEWVHGVKASVNIEESRPYKGFCWEEKISIDGQNADVRHEFSEYKPYEYAAIKTDLPMGGWLKKTFAFKEESGKTKLEIEMTWNLGILEMLAGPAKVQAALEKSLFKTLENWKARV